jgi:hypothetical protein
MGYTNKEEAIAIAKQRIQDRDVTKEIEEDQRKANEEETRVTAKPKK